jgi:putative hydrolase of the HAD superfamily
LRAVVFDLDDTLYPERSYVISGFAAVSEWTSQRFGVSAARCFIELDSLFERGAQRDTFDRWVSERGLPSDANLINDMLQVYRAHDPVIAPYRGVPELLARLQKGYRLGLVSDGHPERQLSKLKGLGLESFFHAVVFTDELGPECGKPSPIPFRVVLERLAVVGPEAVYVGDNPLKDFIGARDLGMRTIRVRHVLGLRSHLEPPGERWRAEHDVGAPTLIEPILKSMSVSKVLDSEGP